MTSAPPLANTIRERLQKAFGPLRLDIQDDSARHIGHAGHNGRGESHFRVTIVSATFDGMTRPARHRMVYDVLNDLMEKRIHALSIKALTPSEAPSLYGE